MHVRIFVHYAMKPDHEIAELYSDLETNWPAMQISENLNSILLASRGSQVGERKPGKIFRGFVSS